MADNSAVSEVLTDAVKEASTSSDPNNLSLESLVLLINTERLKRLENKITHEFIELKKRQDQVTFLHKLIKTINIATANEEFDCTNNPELKELLKKAKEYGVEMKDDKFKFSKEERERLIENIRITAEDYNVLNDMQLQTITRLTTERYESYQLARSIMKPLHEDKINKARGMGGR
jgi:predicted peroxiredoxin